MVKQVILSFSEGDLNTGFTVNLRIQEDDKDGNLKGDICQIPGKLPCAHHVDDLLCEWQKNFSKKVRQKISRGKPGKITKSCLIDNLRQSADDLTRQINEWLDSGETDWGKIRDGMQQHLDKNDEIRVIIQTRDMRLWQMPWQIWNLFANDYSGAEIAVAPTEAQSPKTSSTKTLKARILAVLGRSEEIDVDSDGKLLDSLRGAKIELLTKPTKKDLLARLWDKNGWDIFFFAGHSETQHGEIGLLHLNEKETLGISELKNSMKEAVQRGLQLAIFNSCDGLGLAKQLSELHLPQSIVMREPIPDRVAQEFLKDFLRAFSNGASFYASVREARGRMEDSFNQEYPGIAWLPVICQNPTVRQPFWNDLRVIRPFLKKAVIFIFIMLIMLCLTYYLPQSDMLQKIYSIIPSPKADSWTEPLTGMEFVWVPKGCYEMGCNSGNSKCQPREECLNGFWIGKHEVTHGQWKMIMGDNPSEFEDCGDNCPVEMVSWEDVRLFMAKLNKKTDQHFRLPNEAEWEYACQSGGKSEKYSGGNSPNSFAWYGDNEGSPQPVGGRRPNGLGIYDMSGNVWELSENIYDDHSDIVIRGGAWGYPQQDIRCISRYRSPGVPAHDIGFRLVRE